MRTAYQPYFHGGFGHLEDVQVTHFLATLQVRLSCPDAPVDETAWAAVWPMLRPAGDVAWPERAGEWTHGPEYRG